MDITNIETAWAKAEELISQHCHLVSQDDPSIDELSETNDALIKANTELKEMMPKKEPTKGKEKGKAGQKGKVKGHDDPEAEPQQEKGKGFVKGDGKGKDDGKGDGK